MRCILQVIADGDHVSPGRTTSLSSLLRVANASLATDVQPGQQKRHGNLISWLSRAGKSSLRPRPRGQKTWPQSQSRPRNRWPQPRHDLACILVLASFHLTLEPLFIYVIFKRNVCKAFLPYAIGFGHVRLFVLSFDTKQPLKYLENRLTWKHQISREHSYGRTEQPYRIWRH